MGNHSVHRSTETGNFVVADKEGNILHTFPSEGEALLQKKFLDDKEVEGKREAKADKHEDKDEAPKHGRHR